MKIVIVLSILTICLYIPASSNDNESDDGKKYNVKVLEKCILDFYKSPEKSKGQKLVDDLGAYIIGLYRFMRKMKEGDKKLTQEGIEYFKNGKPEFMNLPYNEKEFQDMMNCSHYESQHYRYLRKDIELAWEHLEEHIEDLKSSTTTELNTPLD